APSSDDDWKQQGKAATTDGLGIVTLTAQAPRVVTALGSELTLVVKTELEDRATVAGGQPVAVAELRLESGELVPGTKQRAFLHVDNDGDGVAGSFIVEADGLKATVATDRDGDGELTWSVPADVGAKRDAGP